METIVTIEKVQLFLGVLLAVCILVVTAIMLDLWDGVYTARKTNRQIHSHKLRVTVGKMSEYWRFLIIAFLIDCIGIIFSFYVMPFVVLLFGLGLIVIEIKSMLEHARRRKSHAMQLPDIIERIIECAHRKDAKRIIALLSDKTEEGDKTEK